jgi:hypothetical protein
MCNRKNRSEQAPITNLGTPILRPHLFTLAPWAKSYLEDDEFKPILRSKQESSPRNIAAVESPLEKGGVGIFFS